MGQRLKHKTRNCKVKLILEENIGKNLLDNGLGNDFFNITPKAQATK